MRIVIAIEGVDGAGKTSLALFLQGLCEQYGHRFTLIGRRGTHASPLVTKFTRFLHEEHPQLCAPADILMRLAREYQRACQAAATPGGIVVLDRFVLSVLSLVRVNGQDMNTMLPFFKEIIARAHLHATLLVDCPFDVACARVQERMPGLPSKRSYGEPLLRRLGQFVGEDFEQGLLTGQQWRVDNGGKLETAQEQLWSYLLPYFRREEKERPVQPVVPAP